METLKNKVAIVGVGYTPQGEQTKGRLECRSGLSLNLEAIKNAIEDAGLRREDIDGIITKVEPRDPDLSPWRMAQELGIHLRFGHEQQMMGATPVGMLFPAAAALIYGLANYVVCTIGESLLGSRTRRGTGFHGGARGGSEGAAFGMFSVASSYALAARRGMYEFGTGPETWKHIAVNQRKWANLNPRAVMGAKTMTFDDYYNSPMIVEPFRLFDTCLVSDCGRAIIMTTAERAKDCKQLPVYLMGVGQDHPATSPIHATHLAGPIGSKLSGQEALRMAGITRKDIDAVEIYDCFTYTVEITMQGYGFYGPGEGKDFFANGRTAPGGEFPVNTSGGLLSEAYEQMTHVTEAVEQLRGNAGERQLGPKTKTKEPEIILVSGNGGNAFQTHATAILGR